MILCCSKGNTKYFLLDGGLAAQYPLLVVELHTHLKAARLDAHKSPDEAAAYINVKADMIYRFERGASQPNLAQIGLLAECYGKQVGDMFPSTQPRMRDLGKFVMALEAFDEDERAAAIEHATRQLQFAAALAASRAAKATAAGKNGDHHDNDAPIPRYQFR